MTMRDGHHLGEDLASMARGGDDLGAAERAEHEAHIADCRDCQRAIDEAQHILQAFEAAPDLEPSVGFDRAMFAKLDEIDRELQPTLRDRLKGFFAWPQLVFGAIATVAAVVGLVLWWPWAAGPSATRADMALVATHIDLLEILDVLEEIELYDNLDVLDDLEVIEALDELEAG